MEDETAIRNAPVLQQTVLLGLVRAASRGDAPARVDEVRSVCNRRLDVVTGRLSEGDVARSLNELAASGVVDEVSVDDRSAVGKGRPAYAPAVDTADALDALEADDDLRPLVETVREERS